MVDDEGHFVQPIKLWVVTAWHNGFVTVVHVLGYLLIAVSRKHLRHTGHFQERAVTQLVIMYNINISQCFSVIISLNKKIIIIVAIIHQFLSIA